MSEMIERVARAMMEQDALGATADGPGIHRGGWRAYEGMARAAIAAEREPTEAMVTGGEVAMFEWRPKPESWTLDMTREAWRAMIDAALKSD
jgi:hypothetical protein